MSNEWSAIKSLLLSRLLSTQLMHNVSCAMFATFVALSIIVMKKSALQISAAICWKTCSIKTFIILLWMSLEVYLSPFGFIQSFRNGLFSARKQYHCWNLKLISPALSPCNSNACHGRNRALDSVLDSTSSRLTNFSTDYSLEDVSPTFSVHVERTRVRSTASLWPFIFPVGIFFKNPSWCNIVAGDAILVVCSYTYMEKCSTTRLVVMNARMYKRIIFLERTCLYFLLSEFMVRKFFLRLMKHVTRLRNVLKPLFLWDPRSCWWQRWSHEDCWCCFWRRWSNGDCWCCCWRRFFAFKYLCNILGVLSSSL